VDEVVAVVDHDVGRSDETAEARRCFVGHDPEPSAMALDFHGLAGFEHMVEDPIDVAPQFRRSENHAITMVRTVKAARWYVRHPGPRHSTIRPGR
jgi:hypothetical protein